MKKIISILLVLLIVYSCKKLDTYGNANATQLLAPTNLELCSSYGSVSIHWTDNASNEDSFLIARSVDSINYITIGIAPKNTSLFVDTAILNTTTTYYYSVVAVNATGKSDPIITSVRIVNTYIPSDSIVVGTGQQYQVWKSKNLETSYYNNGDTIPEVSDPLVWSNLSTGAWCWYNNDSANYAQFGKLYNWYALTDPRGIAPAGWHVASLNDWNILIKNLDAAADVSNQTGKASTKVGAQLKETCFAHWSFPNSTATDTIHFRALPGHGRNENGQFDNNNYGVWWTASSAGDPATAWGLSISENDGSIFKGYHNKNHAYSVRLLKD